MTLFVDFFHWMTAKPPYPETEFTSLIHKIFLILYFFHLLLKHFLYFENSFLYSVHSVNPVILSIMMILL
jgi:hypothetical protein